MAARIDSSGRKATLLSQIAMHLPLEEELIQSYFNTADTVSAHEALSATSSVLPFGA